jgi:hypothetical protein
MGKYLGYDSGVHIGFIDEQNQSLETHATVL